LVQPDQRRQYSDFDRVLQPVAAVDVAAGAVSARCLILSTGTASHPSPPRLSPSEVFFGLLANARRHAAEVGGMGKSKRHSQRDATWPYRSAVVEGLEGRMLLSSYAVTNTNDSGAGSLRQAILDANKHAGADTITFAIGSGPKTIVPTKRLDALGDGTSIDATTQPGYAGKPIITIDGVNAGSSANGIKVTGSGVIVRGLVINRFGASGIFLYAAGGTRIVNCYIGTDSTGSGAAGNKAHGIIVQSPNNVIGGPSAADRNVISANGNAGVFIYTGVAKNNRVEGNYIGTDATGTKKLGNARNGVQMDAAPSNLIVRNVISSNGRDGVLIVNGGSTLNVVQSNKIGTTASGTGRLGNGWYGVEVSRPANTIGGRGAGNVIGSNGQSGVVLYQATASGNAVEGNFIGTDVTGRKNLANAGRGVDLTNGAHDNRIGGMAAGQGNVINYNVGGGIGIYNGAKANVIQGNQGSQMAAKAAAAAAPSPKERDEVSQLLEMAKNG
jgi:hypothetical protein